MSGRIVTADEAAALVAAAPESLTVVATSQHFSDVLPASEERVIASDVTHAHAHLLAAAPDLAHTVVAQAAEIERLRAIIDGRTTPPTDAQIRDAAHAGLTVILHAIDSRTGRIVDLRTRDVPLVSVWATHHAEGHFASAVWRLVDANDRPREWSVPSEPR